jgi:opacity protein-like surface antigen
MVVDTRATLATGQGHLPQATIRPSKIYAVVGLASAAFLFMVSSATAQNCTISPNAAQHGAGVTVTSVAVAANVAANVAAANTAFLTQSTAFVSAPGNPQPDQPGGGVWTRGVGGQVDIKSASSNTVAFINNPPGTTVTNSVPCNTTIRSSFGGVQFGFDIARLNLNGWNVSLGATAGALYLGNSAVGGATIIQPGFTATQVSTTQAPFDSSAQVPFIGGYAVATNGGFFADAFLRADAYQMSFNSPQHNLFNQNMGARGIVLGGSAGYYYEIPNGKGWFIEPSAGLLYSRVKVDDLNLLNSPTAFPPELGGLGVSLPGTLTFNDITQTIGRLGLRIGTSFSYGSLTLQPFASASVWHDFSGRTTASFTSCPGCLGDASSGAFVPGVGQNTYSGTNIGTYGQYSIGMSGVVANTGWLGFVRADYRSGNNLSGWDGTGGLRYQFTPEAVAAMPVKAPVRKAPVHEIITWDGFYVGVLAGAQIGSALWGYSGGAVSPRVAGILGGAYAGFNWQDGAWVYGIEADFSFTDSKGGTGCGPLSIQQLAGIVSPLYEMTCNTRQSWIATVTPRIGFAWDRALFYAKGGLALTREKFSADCNFGPTNGVALFNFGIVGQACGPVNPTSFLSASNGFSASGFRAGWTIGYGVQFALNQRWSAKAEADYVAFEDHVITASDGTPLNVGMHLWQAKVGLSYRFGGRAAGF